MQEKIEYVMDGKGGRSLDEQVMSRMASRISKQRDGGYVNDLEKAKANKATNTLSMPKPMLAAKLADVTLPEEFYLQYKYDGNRCIITKQNGKVFAYSRNGKMFNSIDHILEAAKDIPEGTILDGELYCHGVPLQTLRSWIAKKQAESNSLIYVCYDIMENTGYENRVLSLEKLGLDYPITLAKNELITREKGLEKGILSRLSEARKEGYEGLIARVKGVKYEDGKRSKSLVKIKAWMDSEFTVVDIESSADGWAILVCDSPKGVFRVSSPGTIELKEHVLASKEFYIGKKVTVEYANLTNRGIPFHPVAIAWRGQLD
jgi:ATP-dependent DNA ligase